MKKEEVNLDQMKGKNPFKVPSGYMAGLTDQIMNRLPEKQVEQERPIFFMDRVRPWLYMAAVFVGLGLFFKAIIDVDNLEKKDTTESLLVRTEVKSPISIDGEISEEDDYLEYLEAQYIDCLLDEEFLYIE